MKQGQTEVKSFMGGEEEKVVGMADYPIYETGQEAIDGLGEAKLLKLVNAQIRTDAMNKVRAAYNQKPTKTALRNKAMAAITVEEFTGVAGDPAKLETLIQKKMADIEKAEEGATTNGGAGE